MKTNTLRYVTTEVCEREVDPWLESHLFQYANELKAVLRTLRVVSQKLPKDLNPAPVFSVK
jgi:hypothetical protein